MTSLSDSTILISHLRGDRRATDLADYLIAAGAEEAEATLVTLNVRHFPMIEGLTAPW